MIDVSTIWKRIVSADWNSPFLPLENLWFLEVIFLPFCFFSLASCITFATTRLVLWTTWSSYEKRISYLHTIFCLIITILNFERRYIHNFGVRLPMGKTSRKRIHQIVYNVWLCRVRSSVYSNWAKFFVNWQIEKVRTVAVRFNAWLSAVPKPL